MAENIWRDQFLLARVKYPYQFRRVTVPELWDESAWMSIVVATCEQIDEILTSDAKESFAWSQIKEKYGGLRMYFEGQAKRVDIFTPTRLYSYWEPNIWPTTHWTQRAHQVALVAEKRSRTVCYVCGNPGGLRTHLPRLLTVCPLHGDWDGA